MVETNTDAGPGQSDEATGGRVDGGNDSDHTRRRVLKTGVLAAVGLAGCTSLGGQSATSMERDQPAGSSRTTSSSATRSPAATATATARTNREIERLRQRVEDLRSRLSTGSERVASLESELASERERLDELQADLGNRTQRVETLEARVASRERRIDELETKLEERTNEFSAEVRETAKATGTTTRESVVYIRAELDRGFRTGTGWFLEDDVIVTNGHVVSGVDELECWLPSGDSFSATVLDSKHGSYGDVGHIDVGVARSDRTGPALDAGSAATLSSDQPLVQVGHPSFVGNWVLSLGRFVRTDPIFGFLSSIPTMSGSSGSPVVTLDGTVVGLTGGSTDDESSPSDAGRPAIGSETVRTSFEGESYATHNSIEAVTTFVDDVA